MIKPIRMRWKGHVACMRHMRNTYKTLAGKPEGTKPRERPRCRWENVIKIEIREVV
jgi:hypothetical protein